MDAIRRFFLELKGARGHASRCFRELKGARGHAGRCFRELVDAVGGNVAVCELMNEGSDVFAD